MRSLVLGLSLLAFQLLIGSACTSTAAAMNEDNPNGPVELSLSTKHDDARFKLGESTYRIHLREITDSRCPANAKCIWSGELAAELSADRTLSGRKESKQFTLGQETMPNLKALGASFELLSITETSLTVRVTAE